MLLEMLQVRSTTRMASWNDVVAQALGAVVGAVAWSRTGARVIRWLRNLATERESAAFTARLLQLYLMMYLLVQVTPFDRFRAAEVAAKYGEGRVTLCRGRRTASIVALQNFIGNTLLNIPVGVFAVLGWRRRGRPAAVGRAVLLGVSIVVAMAIAQEFMWWHHGGARDLLAGVLGVGCGIAAARQLACPRVNSRLHPRRRPHPWYLVAAAIWTLALAWYYWNPFDFELTSEIVKRRLTRSPLTPVRLLLLVRVVQDEPVPGRSRDVGYVLVGSAARFTAATGVACRSAIGISGDVQGIAITLGATGILLGDRVRADVAADAVPRRDGRVDRRVRLHGWLCGRHSARCHETTAMESLQQPVRRWPRRRERPNNPSRQPLEIVVTIGTPATDAASSAATAPGQHRAGIWLVAAVAGLLLIIVAPVIIQGGLLADDYFICLRPVHESGYRTYLDAIWHDTGIVRPARFIELFLISKTCTSVPYGLVMLVPLGLKFAAGFLLYLLLRDLRVPTPWPEVGAALVAAGARRNGGSPLACGAPRSSRRSSSALQRFDCIEEGRSVGRRLPASARRYPSSRSFSLCRSPSG